MPSPKPTWTLSQQSKLHAIWEHCDIEDKSTAYMLALMVDLGKLEDSSEALDFMESDLGNKARGHWRELRKEGIENGLSLTDFMVIDIDSTN